MFTQASQCTAITCFTVVSSTGKQNNDPGTQELRKLLLQTAKITDPSFLATKQKQQITECLRMGNCQNHLGDVFQEIIEYITYEQDPNNNDPLSGLILGVVFGTIAVIAIIVGYIISRRYDIWFWQQKEEKRRYLNFPDIV